MKVRCVLENNFPYSRGNITFSSLFRGIKKESYDILTDEQYVGITLNKHGNVILHEYIFRNRL